MPIQNLFSIPIYWNDLKLDNDKIKNIALAQQTEEPKPWAQSCKTSFFIDRQLYKNEELRFFSEAIIHEIEEYCTQLDVDLDNFVVGIREMWVNRYERGDSQEVHIHPGNHISGIYYVEGDKDCAATRFVSPLQEMEMYPLPVKQRTDSINLAVVPGRIVLFRSWLRHHVETQNVDGKRTTIAFNAIVLPKNSTPMEGGVVSI